MIQYQDSQGDIDKFLYTTKQFIFHENYRYFII